MIDRLGGDQLSTMIIALAESLYSRYWRMVKVGNVPSEVSPLRIPFATYWTSERVVFLDN